MHAKEVIHMDLSLLNVLWDESKNIKIRKNMLICVCSSFGFKLLGADFKIYKSTNPNFSKDLLPRNLIFFQKRILPRNLTATISVRMYIRGRGKIGYLTGEKKEPKPKDSAYSTWDAENSMVMTWLVHSMTEDISCNYMCYLTAKELLDNVNQMYSDLGNQSQVYELTLKLGNILQGNDNVTKYFNSLKSLWQALDLFNDYEWKSIKDANYNKKTGFTNFLPASMSSLMR
ncbi:hypothetical protein ACOSQ3_024468 [Xanthoceras sorbifolium]